MPTTARPSIRRPVTRRPLLFLLVGALAAALVATFVQVRPPSSALDVVNNVDITHGTTEAGLKVGTEDACVIASRTTISGDPKRVQEVIDATSTSARQAGFTVTTAGRPNPAPKQVATYLILSQELPMSDPAFGLENCTTDLVIDAHRGRRTAELPAWVTEMLAVAAATAVYLTVVFAVTALFAFLAPEFFVVGELIGGCVGGFAATFIYNLITKAQEGVNLLIQSATDCLSGAILNVTLGTIKMEVVSSLRRWLESPTVATVITEGASRAGSSAGSEALNEIVEAARALSFDVEGATTP